MRSTSQVSVVQLAPSFAAFVIRLEIFEITASGATFNRSKRVATHSTHNAYAKQDSIDYAPCIVKTDAILARSSSGLDITHAIQGSVDAAGELGLDLQTWFWAPWRAGKEYDFLFHRMNKSTEVASDDM